MFYFLNWFYFFCRIFGIRLFGIEDKEFKVYVDIVLLDDESLFKCFKRLVMLYYDVDRFSF